MPTYQYACTECGHGFDIVQSFADDSLTVCPECSGRLRKVFNAVGVVFKGSGFYRTDSRGKQSAAESSAGSSSGSSSPSSSTESSSGSTSGASASNGSSGNGGSGSKSDSSSSTSGSKKTAPSKA